jgi:hypothetical protein
MQLNLLEKNLEIWKKILFIGIGATSTLLATGIAELPNRSQPYFPGWYAVWFIIFLASIIPGFVLLWGKHWLTIPLEKRLNIIFGFFGLTWVTFLSIGTTIIWGGAHEFVYFLLCLAVIIAVPYILLRRRTQKKAEEIFP